jgi:hypothetical protein
VELGERRLDVFELVRYLEVLHLDSEQFFSEYLRGAENLRSSAGEKLQL